MSGFGDAVQGGGVAGTSEIDDNLASSVLIESADGEDYLAIDTTDNASKVVLLGTHTAADNESSGMVGIREATPKAPLHIVGAGGSTGISIDPTVNYSPTLVIENSTGNSKDRCLVLLNGDGGDGSAVSFRQADTERLYISSNKDSSGPVVYSIGSLELKLGTNNTERMRITSDGKVGIGEDTPLGADGGSVHIKTGDSGSSSASGDCDELIVEGSGNSGITIFSGANDTTTNFGGLAFGRADSGTNGRYRGGVNYRHGSSNDYLQFLTAGTTKIIVDKDGKLSTGLTSPGALCDSNGIHIKTGDAAHTTVHADWNDLIVESAGRCGITLMSKHDGDHYSALTFATSGAAEEGYIRYDHSNNNMNFRTNSSDRVHITATGSVGIGSSTIGTNGASVLLIKNGTAPASSPADSIQLYAEDVRGSSELKVRDEAGNVTTLSPHNFSLTERSDPMAWAYYSRNEFAGKELNVDMMRVIRKLEELTGETFITVRDLPSEQCLDWDTEEQKKLEQSEKDIADWDAQPQGSKNGKRPLTYEKQPKPTWLD